MSEFIKAQQELRANLTMQIRDVIESAETESRGLDAAELQKIDAIEADIRKADETISVATRNEERKVEASAAAKGFIPAVSERSASDILRNVAESRSAHTFEQRAALVSSANTVPKSFYNQVFDIARLAGPMLEVSDVINTPSGESLTIPTLGAYSTASLTAAATALTASEPTYSAITLDAYKYGFLIQADNSLVADAGFDLASHLANQAGNAIGYATNAALTTGTGTAQPNGIATAAGAGVTGGTSVAGAFTADDLIDLAYSVDGATRRKASAGFMANGQTIDAMRKLKDGAGNYLYQVGVGYPDTFAGFSVTENPHVADIAIDADSVLFGSLDSYKVRVAGGLQVASSTDYAFNTDLTTWRFVIRLDGDLTSSTEVVKFTGAAS